MPYNGKLKYVVYGNGYVEKYVYDKLDRVSEIWYYQISGTIPTSDIIHMEVKHGEKR